MRPRSPDELLWRYLELGERLGSPAGQNLVAETGLVFAEACVRCGASPDHRTAVQKGPATAYRCGVCQAVWPARIAFLLRNQVGSWRSGRRSGGKLEAMMNELAGYGLVLSRLTMRERRVYLRLYVLEQRGCYAAVAVEANRRWPRMRPMRDGRVAGPRWTEWHVRQVCDSARRTIGQAARGAMAS